MLFNFKNYYYVSYKQTPLDFIFVYRKSKPGLNVLVQIVCATLKPVIVMLKKKVYTCVINKWLFFNSVLASDKLLVF